MKISPTSQDINDPKRMQATLAEAHATDQVPDTRTDVGLGLEEGLREALAWKRGAIVLKTRTITKA